MSATKLYLPHIYVQFGKTIPHLDSSKAVRQNRRSISFIDPLDADLARRTGAEVPLSTLMNKTYVINLPVVIIIS